MGGNGGKQTSTASIAPTTVVGSAEKGQVFKTFSVHVACDVKAGFDELSRVFLNRGSIDGEIVA
jgi:hypothetical protein